LAFSDAKNSQNNNFGEISANKKVASDKSSQRKSHLGATDKGGDLNRAHE